jgi:murein L,D-transpeptidase YcbB/YkuD
MNRIMNSPDRSAIRATACLHGLAAVVVLWALAFAAGVAFAQEPAPRHWDREVAGTLLTYIEHIDRHGLEPADYAPAALEQAIASGDAQALERRATESFSRVAADLAVGHVRPGRRGRSYIVSDTLDPMRVARLIDTAIEARSVAHALESLAPRNRQYRALRSALVRLTPEQAEERRKIEASLERWRWMPRQMGERHLLVNIPEYRLHVLADGSEIASHRVIVGKPSTPTPQFSAQVTGVIFNPPWNVPQSIVAESVGALVRNNPATARARGYTWSYANGGLRVTQQPGPGNALGQLKLDMPNPFTVYLHDTSNRDLFDGERRTLSHGCVRTDKPFDLAELLLAGTGWTQSRIDDVVKTRRTTRAALTPPVPVHIVYMTAYPAADGTIVYSADPYSLDAAINRLLDDRTGA